MIVNRSQGRTARAALFFASLATILFASVAPAAEIVGSARLNVERESHTATLLRKGTVLLVGGRNAGGPLAVAEIYDPSTRAFSVAGTSLEPRADHAAVRLADGRVLVIGGRGREQALTSTELYDPKTNTFAAGPSLTHARFGHTATLLADGRVVVIGGDATGCAEIYEPASGQFRELEQCLSVPRRLHAAIVLRDGDVLVAGGVGADGASLASAEILDLETLSFSAAPIPMLAARSRLTLRLLPDGKVQAIGGDDEATMELFNPAGRFFTSLGHLGQDRAVLAAALRNTGRAALIGSPASSRPSLVSLAADGVDLGSAGSDVLDRSSYTLTELPGANAAILIGGLTAAGATQQRAVLFSSSSATVTTDKTDYAPGETVVIISGNTLDDVTL
ncbi:MAG: kelch repeat-containing protein, partial [Acidobacteriota bacterium]